MLHLVYYFWEDLYFLYFLYNFYFCLALASISCHYSKTFKSLYRNQLSNFLNLETSLRLKRSMTGYFFFICFQIFEFSSETKQPKCHSKRKENAFNKGCFVWSFHVDAKYKRFIFDSKWGQIFYDVINQWRHFFIF